MSKTAKRRRCIIKAISTIIAVIFCGAIILLPFLAAARIFP